MADEPATVEELTITREESDRFAPRKELKKAVITKGAWSTVAYKFEELKKSKKGEEWVVKYSLVRYRKLKGVFRFQKEFAISNADHVKLIRDAFSEFLESEPAAEEAAEE